jgi:hypothetical protein
MGAALGRQTKADGKAREGREREQHHDGARPPTGT